MEKNAKRKVKLIFTIFTVVFLVITGKAFKVQVLDREKLIQRSKSQFLREVKVYPKRGNIYDRNGNPLALNIQTYSIFTIPKNIKSKSLKPYKQLAKIAPEISLEKIKRKIKNRKKYTWLARKIPLTKEQVKKIKKLKGIYIDSVPKRVYPNHEIASQVLGFVGVDNIGLAGAEYSFDKMLKGEPTVIRYVKDAKGRAIKFEKQSNSESSKDLYLTIDKEIQSVAEKYLKKAVVDFEADYGGVGVMDAETGEVLAMANYPSFDPNDLRGSKAKHRGLSFIASPFEPGSTMKAFTIASALEHNISTPETSYYCERGAFEIDGHIISEAESKKKFEWLSVKEILRYSSNVGTTKVAFDLGFEKLSHTFREFGFGKKLGIELPGESRGIMTDKEKVTPLSLSNLSFGQGIATTGLQMLTGFAMIANGGYFVKPTIVKTDIYKKGKRVMSEKTMTQVEDLLVDVVDNGTGQSSKIKFFQIAGKTSTAQRVDSKGGYKGYVSGFVGYPVNVNKRFVVYAYVDNPKKHYYGSVVAAPVVREVISHILYREKEFDKLAINEETDDNVLDIVKTTQSSKRITSKDTVPNFIGLDKVSVKKILSKLDVRIQESGIGIVSKQIPEAGSTLSDDVIVKLIYSPPHYE